MVPTWIVWALGTLVMAGGAVAAFVLVQIATRFWGATVDSREHCRLLETEGWSVPATLLRGAAEGRSDDSGARGDSGAPVRGRSAGSSADAY